MLVFGGLPLGIIALIALAVYGKSIVRQPNATARASRGTYAPAWYVPHPDAVVRGPAPATVGVARRRRGGGASGEW